MLLTDRRAQCERRKGVAETIFKPLRDAHKTHSQVLHWTLLGEFVYFGSEKGQVRDAELEEWVSKSIR